MATLNFSVAFSTDFEGVKTAPVSSTVFAEDGEFNVGDGKKGNDVIKYS